MTPAPPARLAPDSISSMREPPACNRRRREVMIQAWQSPFGMSGERCLASRSVWAQGQVRSGAGSRAGFFRPLDQRCASGIKEVTGSRCDHPFFRVGKAVKVKMVHGQLRQFVGFHQRIGRVFDPPGMTKAA